MRGLNYKKRCAEIIEMANKIIDASSAADRTEKRILTMRINALSRKARYLSEDHRRRTVEAQAQNSKQD